MPPVTPEFIAQVKETFPPHDLPKAGDIYRHYKGGTYLVIAVAVHTETAQEFIVYRDYFDVNGKIWTRPFRGIDGWSSSIRYYAEGDTVNMNPRRIARFVPCTKEEADVADRNG